MSWKPYKIYFGVESLEPPLPILPAEPAAPFVGPGVGDGGFTLGAGAFPGGGAGLVGELSHPVNSSDAPVKRVAVPVTRRPKIMKLIPWLLYL